MENNYKSLMFFVLTALLVLVPAVKVSAFAGGDGTPENPYQITNCVELQEMQNVDVYNPVHAYYILMNDINCSDTVNWNSGKGFVPIYSFAGNFDGQGHKITDLFINGPMAPAPWNAPHYVGLFGITLNGAIIKNVGLVNVSIHGNGGAVGGLAGVNGGTISNSYASGNVSGVYYVGGLAGDNLAGTITNCYAISTVTGNSDAIGGLVGMNYNGGTITNSYSTGSVTGGSYVGGLLGENVGGVITDSYWDTETSGQPTSAGGAGKTTAEMKQQTTFVDWDFVNIWAIEEGVSYPYFLWQIPLGHNWSGFFQPVDNPPTLNQVNAGRAVPVKFSLSGNMGLNIFAAGYPKSGTIACQTAEVEVVETTVTAAGGSSLTYDPIADQYTYVWKTDKLWGNSCRQLVVKLIDGTIKYANFIFTK